MKPKNYKPKLEVIGKMLQDVIESCNEDDSTEFMINYLTMNLFLRKLEAEMKKDLEEDLNDEHSSTNGAIN